MGRLITSSNYKETYTLYFDHFINVESKRDAYSTWTSAQILEGARIYAKYEMGREKAHLKAFIRGKQNYKYKGKSFEVLRPKVDGPEFFSEILTEKEESE